MRRTSKIIIALMTLVLTISLIGHVWGDDNGTPYWATDNGYETVGGEISPIKFIISPENKTYTINNVSLTFIVSEPTSWIRYSLDGQANVTITGNTTLSGLSDSSHSLVVYAKDTGGHTGASETVCFSIEVPPPEPQPSEPFPITWIAAATVIMATVGVTLVYFRKKENSANKT